MVRLALGRNELDIGFSECHKSKLALRLIGRGKARADWYNGNTFAETLCQIQSNLTGLGYKVASSVTPSSGKAWWCEDKERKETPGVYSVFVKPTGLLSWDQIIVFSSDQLISSAESKLAKTFVVDRGKFYGLQRLRLGIGDYAYHWTDNPTLDNIRGVLKDAGLEQIVAKA